MQLGMLEQDTNGGPRHRSGLSQGEAKDERIDTPPGPPVVVGSATDRNEPPGGVKSARRRIVCRDLKND